METLQIDIDSPLTSPNYYTRRISYDGPPDYQKGIVNCPFEYTTSKLHPEVIHDVLQQKFTEENYIIHDSLMNIKWFFSIEQKSGYSANISISVMDNGVINVRFKIMYGDLVMHKNIFDSICVLLDSTEVSDCSNSDIPLEINTDTSFTYEDDGIPQTPMPTIRKHSLDGSNDYRMPLDDITINTLDRVFDGEFDGVFDGVFDEPNDYRMPLEDITVSVFDDDGSACAAPDDGSAPAPDDVSAPDDGSHDGSAHVSACAAHVSAAHASAAHVSAAHALGPDCKIVTDDDLALDDDASAALVSAATDVSAALVSATDDDVSADAAAHAEEFVFNQYQTSIEMCNALVAKNKTIEELLNNREKTLDERETHLATNITEFTDCVNSYNKQISMQRLTDASAIVLICAFIAVIWY